MKRHESIRTAWDEAGCERWTTEDQKRFDARFKAWARRTGNQTHYEIRLEQGAPPFGIGKSRARQGKK